MPNEEWKLYVEDPRTICKYGNKCYQKNPEHHKTYKHPPQKVIKHTRDKRRFSPYNKKNSESKTDKIKDDEQTTPVNKNDTPVQDESESGNSSNCDPIINKSPVKVPDNIEFHKDFTDSIFKKLFLVDMPKDFYKFHEWLQNEGESIEKTLSSVNLDLIGAYDVLLGKMPILDDEDLYLVHWRFYYDPPELQTVLKKKGNSQFHIGYYRDSPDEPPVFLASTDSSKGCKITPVATNIFAAVYFYLQNEKKSSPFMAIACQKLMDKLKVAAEKYEFEIKEFNMKERQKNIVAKTLHGAGIVTPYEKKTQIGYRHLAETDANLKKIFTKLENATEQSEKDKVLSELQPVITYANIAVDECDFGTGLEAGIALFCSGLKELQPSTLGCLISAYNLLNREAFSKIIQAHLKHRRKGAKLSVLDLQ